LRQILWDMPMPNKPLSIGFNVPFHEAIKAAQKRGVVLPDVYYGELQWLHRQLAFSIAGIAAFDQLEQVRNALSAALQNGTSFNTWKKDILESGTLDLPNHRLDNIFRTNIQNSYNRGLWEQFQRVKHKRPYLMYDAINDSRVRPTHLAMDGIIRPADDPFWQTHAPLNGYRCRCRLINLSEKQAQRRSGENKGLNKPIDPQSMQPDKGWDYNPGADLTEGVRRALDSRQNKGNGVLLMTMMELLSQQPPPVPNDDYYRAASGGKHAGFFNQHNNLSDQELKKSIASFKKQIDNHKKWIENPEIKLGDLSLFDPRQIEALVNKKWPNDIARQTEQMNIIIGILIQRGQKQ